MKKILHLQIPIDSSRPNGILISPEIVGKFATLVQDRIGENWVVITTPFVPSAWSLENVKNFMIESLSKEELMKLIE